MKPIPSPETAARSAEARYSSLLPTPAFGGDLSPSNFRRGSASPIDRVYPWLLLASTAIATVFCFMYITKPVIQAAPTAAVVPAKAAPPPTTKEVLASAPQKPPTIAPAADRLPGDPATAKLSPLPANLPAFEETNLRVQHVLTAQAPAGNLCDIVLDVPVLYRSRQLRWTQGDVAQARDLLNRLADYQEKSIALRSEAQTLLTEWNILISRSIPSGELRADSPSLPGNAHISSAPLPADLNTSEAIQIKASTK